VDVQEVRWGKAGTVRARDYFYCCENETNVFNWEEDFLTHRIVSAVKIVEFNSDRVSYIVLRVC
jgi:hypothetical protein